ncbi:MAG: TVP38/TMEM64 family protein [Opitutales bacterium]|jgi:uncharacterized membrane protein YdjX (TVP38/TMEM64 family)
MIKLAHRSYLIFAIVAVLAALGVLLWMGYSYREQLPQIRESVLAFLESVPPWAYFFAFVVLPAAGVPLALFYLTALPVLGGIHPMAAIPLALTAVALNMVLANLLARGILHPAIEWVIRHRHLAIPKIQPRNEWRIVLTMRLSPVPYFLQNYILSLGHARWRTYLGLSILIQGTIGTTIMLVGESILQGGLPYVLLALFTLLLLHLLFDHIRNRLNRDRKPSN